MAQKAFPSVHQSEKIKRLFPFQGRISICVDGSRLKCWFAAVIQSHYGFFLLLLVSRRKMKDEQTSHRNNSTVVVGCFFLGYRHSGPEMTHGANISWPRRGVSVFCLCGGTRNSFIVVALASVFTRQVLSRSLHASGIGKLTLQIETSVALVFDGNPHRVPTISSLLIHHLFILNPQ